MISTGHLRYARSAVQRQPTVTATSDDDAAPVGAEEINEEDDASEADDEADDDIEVDPDIPVTAD